MTEADLAGSVVAWFERRGRTVYQEVEFQGARADIVAVKAPLTYVVETKLTFGFAVLEQARRWLAQAHLVSVAVPYRTGWQGVCTDTCQWLGIGWLRVGVLAVDEFVAPRLHRRVSARLRDLLRPEHQTYAKAGTNGGYYSAWRASIAHLAETMQRHPNGLIVKEAVAETPHHYGTEKSAQGCLLRAVQAGIVAGVRADKRNGRWWFHATDADAAALGAR